MTIDILIKLTAGRFGRRFMFEQWAVIMHDLRIVLFSNCQLASLVLRDIILSPREQKTDKPPIIHFSHSTVKQLLGIADRVFLTLHGSWNAKTPRLMQCIHNRSTSFRFAWSQVATDSRLHRNTKKVIITCPFFIWNRLRLWVCDEHFMFSALACLLLLVRMRENTLNVVTLNF